MIEHKVTTQGIKMSKRVEPVVVTKQETIALPKAKPIIVEGVPMVIKVKCTEPKVN
jgi:hypothetical protein